MFIVSQQSPGLAVGVENDIPPSTGSEKQAAGERQKVASKHGEEDTLEEQPMELVEEAPTADDESGEETVQVDEGLSPVPSGGDSSDNRNSESFSTSMELPHLHEEELIYEGDAETDIVKDAEQSLDTKGDDSGEEIVFDLSKEVGIQLDATDSEQKTSFSDGKLADESLKQKERSSTVGKPASGEEALRFVFSLHENF